MDSDDEAGEPVTKDAPNSHRRLGPAVVRLPSEKRFWKSVWEDPRELLGLVAAVFLALVFGSDEVTSGGSVVHHVLGGVVVVAGVVLAASYALQFHPAFLESERWSRSLLRRAVRAMLKYTYGVFYAILLVAALVWLITWLADRF